MRALMMVSVLAFCGCVDQQPTDCGPMPEIPEMSGQIFNGADGAPSKVIIAAGQWYANRAWVLKIEEWGACASANR